MIAVTNHAALRFVQRVMEIDIEELTKEQETKAKAKILDNLTSLSDQIHTLECADVRVENFTYVIVDGVVVTISDDPRVGASGAPLRGGIRRSGCKKKKTQQMSRYERKQQCLIN